MEETEGAERSRKLEGRELTSQHSVQLQVWVGVYGNHWLVALLPDSQVAPARVHCQGSNAPAPEAAQAGLLQGGELQYLHQVPCREGHHISGQHCQVAALQTLVAKGVAGVWSRLRHTVCVYEAILPCECVAW